MGHSTPISWSVRACMLGLALLSLFASALAVPVNSVSSSATLSRRANETKPFELRIMPLGASITTGLKSSDKNGYRKVLRDGLLEAGWEVDMVGSLKSGTMEDNDNEGHSGYRIEQVAKAAEKTIPQQPNLILLNAGTNDATQNYHMSTVGDRMDSLVGRLFDAIPGTTVILSTLLPNTNSPNRVKTVSKHIRQIVADRREKGQKIVLAEMSDVITVDELFDDTHPTDEGYAKMAVRWLETIEEAEKEGFLQKANKHT